MKKRDQKSASRMANNSALKQKKKKQGDFSLKKKKKKKKTKLFLNLQETALRSQMKSKKKTLITWLKNRESGYKNFDIKRKLYGPDNGIADIRDFIKAFDLNVKFFSKRSSGIIDIVHEIDKERNGYYSIN